MTASTAEIMDGLRRFDKGSHDFPEIGPAETRDLGTALYDALYYTTKEKLKQADERRRAIVLFSDGEENSSEHDLLDAIQAAQDNDTIIYCIRYTDAERHPKKGAKKRVQTNEEDAVGDTGAKLGARNRYGIRVMRHLAALTGGSDFDALDSDLGEVFAQIGKELHSLYSIGFVSSNAQHDGGFRKLTIQCKRQNAVVRAKSGYYAR